MEGLLKKGMSVGVVPGAGNQPLHPLPNHVGGGRWRVALRRRERSWSSASFRTRAVLEERGFVAPKGTFYELLGISEGGSHEDIKKAYKQLARKYHPDVSPANRTEEYTRRFIEVHEAYETLSDPGRRALYDRDLARGLHLAFSTRKRFDEELEDISSWRNHWQDQIVELKRRSMNKDDGEDQSWGARMRRQRAEASIE